MLMWPSWLQHRTTPNYDGDPRIIMSFNIDEETAVKLVQAISHKEESTLTINY